MSGTLHVGNWVNIKRQQIVELEYLYSTKQSIEM